jgi:hypothetical protein
MDEIKNINNEIINILKDFNIEDSNYDNNKKSVFYVESKEKNIIDNNSEIFSENTNNLIDSKCKEEIDNIVKKKIPLKTPENISIIINIILLLSKKITQEEFLKNIKFIEKNDYSYKKILWMVHILKLLKIKRLDLAYNRLLLIYIKKKLENNITILLHNYKDLNLRVNKLHNVIEDSNYTYIVSSIKTFLDSKEGQLFSLEEQKTLLPNDFGYDGFYMARLKRNQ